MKPLELDPRRLQEFLVDLVERFRRETGIAAHFVSELEEIPLRPRACAELGRIVQEALANVRKHSGARNVIVRVTAEDGDWKVIVDDDGRGFPFSGRLGQAELDAARAAPSSSRSACARSAASSRSSRPPSTGRASRSPFRG